MKARKFRPHRRQWEALNSKARYTAMVSGVQGGKTTAGAMWLAMQVAKDKTANYLVVFPTYPIGKQSTMPKFLDLFPQSWGKWIERDKVFRLNGGGSIWFRSAEDPQSLEGITAKAAWIDEAGQISSLAWETIQARLSIAQGPAFLTTTPYTMNWLYHDFVRLAEAGDSNYKVVQYSSNESPYFPQEQYDRMKKSLDSRRFALKFGGQFTRMEGLVYKDFDRVRHTIPAHTIPVNAQVIAGVDFGTKVPSAVLWGYRDEKDRLVIFKEFYQVGQTAKKMAKVLNITPVNAIYCDPNPASFVLELRQTYGIKNVIAADNTHETGIARVQSMFAEDKILIFDSCKNLINELETYHYKDDKEGLLTDVVVKKDDHACDALRYMSNTHVTRPTLLSSPKKAQSMYFPDNEKPWYGAA